MANLIRVDNKFINLDNVTEIHSYQLHGWNVIVYYANPVNGNGNGTSNVNGNGNGTSNVNGNGTKNSNGHGNGHIHSDEHIQQDFEHFTGHEADALREWLEKHATDVLAWYKTQDRNGITYSREYA